VREERDARAAGLAPIKACEFKIVGQTALLHSALQLSLAATADVDVFTDAHFVVKAKLNELLQAIGLELDPLSDEIWMPEETRYDALFSGTLVKAAYAQAIYVLVSKACKAPEKNRTLLRAYLAGDPSEDFVRLCHKYGADLSRLV
jgi:hypothetical protein